MSRNAKSKFKVGSRPKAHLVTVQVRLRIDPAWPEQLKIVELELMTGELPQEKFGTYWSEDFGNKRNFIGRNAFDFQHDY